MASGSRRLLAVVVVVIIAVAVAVAVIAARSRSANRCDSVGSAAESNRRLTVLTTRACQTHVQAACTAP